MLASEIHMLASVPVIKAAGCLGNYSANNLTPADSDCLQYNFIATML